MRILSDNGTGHSSQTKTPKRARRAEKTEREHDLGNGQNIVKKQRPAKNEAAIRAKLRAKKQEELKENQEAQKTDSKPVQNVEGDEKENDMLLKSDINKNDPSDPNVREKLKDILKTGAFNFNQKEKSALSKILNEA